VELATTIAPRNAEAGKLRWTWAAADKPTTQVIKATRKYKVRRHMIM